jgi:hypothetical protein
MPFAILLLVVFLYRHLLSILTFFWLTSLLHNANERMRKQTLLKENRSRRGLLGVAGLLLALAGCVFLLQGSRLLHQLCLRRVDDLSSNPPNLSRLLWDVIQAGTHTLPLTLPLTRPLTLPPTRPNLSRLPHRLVRHRTQAHHAFPPHTHPPLGLTIFLATRTRTRVRRLSHPIPCPSHPIPSLCATWQTSVRGRSSS